MIDSFVVGQKLIINRNYSHHNYTEMKDEILVVAERDNDYLSDVCIGKLSNEKGSIVYHGTLNTKHFDYYGVHINHEILDLINRHQVKSFQAVLDDGRVIHVSCLN